MPHLPDLELRLRAALSDRYRVQRQIGRGGMGSVFLADDLKHGRLVAVKVLHPELAGALGPERFVREIEIASSLVHPHIVPLFDSGTAEGLLFYVMPYVDGESLRDRLRREPQLPVAEAVRIATEVADALAFAHTRGVVHRDIKPENILLEAGHAVVADFGAARAVSAAAEAWATSPGLAIGTPAYMSPEQAAGAGDVDGRADVYALGCVLYEMLVGMPPFTGPTPRAVVARQLADPPPPLRTVRPGLPAALEDAVLLALAKVPADRFPDAASFARTLSAAVAGGPPRRRFARGAVGIAALAAALGMVRLGLHRTGSDGTPPRQPVPGASSVAVLYFEDLSPQHALRHLADGLTEDLIDRLADVSALRVISPDGVGPYRAQGVPPESLAHRLGIGTLVTGSITAAGQRLRVSVRVTDASSGVQLSSQSFEQPLGDLLVLRDRLAEAVARQLRIRLGEAVQLHDRRSATSVPAAWDLLLRAERLRDQCEALLLRDSVLVRRLLLEADSLLADAERLDPEWIEPIVLRGWLQYDRAVWVRASGEETGVPGGSAARPVLAQGIRQAERALRRRPGSPEALELRGTLRYRDWAIGTYAGADEGIGQLAVAAADLRAAAAAPGRIQARALSTLSAVLQFSGELAESNLAARRAYEADAFLRDADAIVLRLFDTSLELQRFGEAAAWCERGQQTFPDNWRFAMCRLVLLAWSPLERPEPSRAWRVLARLDSLATPDERIWLRPQMTMIVAAVLGAAGLGDSAERVIARARSPEATDPDLMYYEALARARLSQNEQAAATLVELLRRLPNLLPYLRARVAFQPLWSDPRLQRITGAPAGSWNRVPAPGPVGIGKVHGPERSRVRRQVTDDAYAVPLGSRDRRRHPQPRGVLGAVQHRVIGNHELVDRHHGEEQRIDRVRVHLHVLRVATAANEG